MSSLIVNAIGELCDAMMRDDENDVWANPGSRDLDAAVAAVADYYIRHPTERSTIRSELQDVESLWSLVLFVRRAGLLLDDVNETIWLNRGLAVASMIDANCDYRDLIVSLVILRWFAQQTGMVTDDAFDTAIQWSSDRVLGILKNARNHRESDIQSTIAAFVPPTITGRKSR